MFKKIKPTKFKAKPVASIEEIKDTLYADELAYLENVIDEDGYAHGYYVGGFIVGEMVEANDEYCTLEYWIPVLPETLMMEVE